MGSVFSKLTKAETKKQTLAGGLFLMDQDLLSSCLSRPNRNSNQSRGTSTNPA